MNRIVLIALLLLTYTAIAQTPCPLPAISGHLLYGNETSTPLQSSLLILQTSDGAKVDSTFTDTEGHYKFCNLQPGVYYINVRPQYLWGGVNTIDAFLCIRYYAGLDSLDGLALQAANVFPSDGINATDALVIRKRSIQMVNSFPACDWIFSRPEITISDTVIQIIDIIGLCAGDANSSYLPIKQTFYHCGDILTDARDGREYPTVQIGDQCWMQKSLNIGTFVPSVLSQFQHSEVSDNWIIEKYCYNNDTAMCEEYGGMYDWDEIMMYDSTPGIQGICPTGWHIPTQDEWCALTTFLDPTVDCSYTGSFTGTIAGGLLKEAGTVHWKTPNTGATNQSGFTALGGGNRSNTGGFGGTRSNSFFWTSSRDNLNRVIWWNAVYNNSKIGRSGYQEMEHAVYLRCIKN